MSRKCPLQGSDYTKNALKILSQRVPGLELQMPELQMPELIPLPRRGMYAAELCPLAGTAGRSFKACVRGISFQ